MEERFGGRYSCEVGFREGLRYCGHAFLDVTLENMGFGSKWRSWMYHCISSPVLSVLVNGSPTEEFGIERGLRQGDPLSPFLFNIVIEMLNCLFKKASVMNLVRGAGKARFMFLTYSSPTI
ncbi:hypothetical protein Dsin_019037 [Dipteronia sinensis]|uniref:Reverse transcriptase domain-containing protein n=1 Tax=Dipteronia sinensis TaxID=43782 RepID=A0AAE0A7Z1_9ROSI|nr:hypothetical protein Dsin_019037 [Dipteronia sinensis]